MQVKKLAYLAKYSLYNFANTDLDNKTFSQIHMVIHTTDHWIHESINKHFMHNHLTNFQKTIESITF